MVKNKASICIHNRNSFTGFIKAAENQYENLEIHDNVEDLINTLRHTITNRPHIIYVEACCVEAFRTSYFYNTEEDNTYVIAIKQANDLTKVSKSGIFEIWTFESGEMLQLSFNHLDTIIDQDRKLYKLKDQMADFFIIGKSLTAKRDINSLLDMIVSTSMKMTGSDAGTIFTIVNKNTSEWSTYDNEDDVNRNFLKFSIAKNNSLDLPFKSAVMPISKESIIGYSVITGSPLRIEDVYEIPEASDYSFNRSFDQKVGYRTKSMLIVPMKDHHGRILGAVQLLNKTQNDTVVEYDIHDEHIIYSLAGQAAVSIENSFLYKEMNNLVADYHKLISKGSIKGKFDDEETNKLMDAVVHSPSAIMITDSQGHILYVNDKFTKLTGYKEDEVLGEKPSILNSGKMAPEFYKNFWETIQSGEDWTGEFHNKRKNGELYWELSSISSILNDNNGIKYFISVKEDITELKTLSQELKDKNQALNNTLYELQQSQAHLIQNEKITAIGQLAAGIAHEINTPLGFITSNVTTLKKYVGKYKSVLSELGNAIDTMSEKEQDLYKKLLKEYKIQFIGEDVGDLIEESVDGLHTVGNIVNALRSFSNIDTLEEVSDYDLNQSISNTLLMLSSEIRDLCEIKTDFGEIPIIECNTTEMNQVLLNMLVNSIYAIKEKEDMKLHSIEIKTSFDNDYIYCSIKDDGIGIKEEHIDKIFDPFFTTKPVGSGAGLGLNTSYTIVNKNHHGDILVESDYGVGTEFVIKLPLTR